MTASRSDGDSSDSKAEEDDIPNYASWPMERN